MLNLFLDSNIWLDLYDFSSDDLNEFGKLADIINQDVKLYITDQVINEVKRNRDKKVYHAYKRFKEIRIMFPNLCKGYDEYNKLIKIKKSFMNIHKELCKKLDDDIKNETLHADKIINKIFSLSEKITEDEAIILRAKKRYDLGNPPGKNKSYGDAINWESLLLKLPNNEDLFMVSSDGDFSSILNEENLNSFLVKEWKSNKMSEIFFYTSLNSFFKKHLKDIELKSEEQKNLLIEKLFNSESFNNTHSIISQLSYYSNFTDKQIEELFRAATSNSQISWILKDSDVYSFYKSIIKGREDIILKNKDFGSIIRELDISPNEIIDDKEAKNDDFPF